MSLNGNHPGTKGKVSTQFKMKKVKDQMHGSSGVWKWKDKTTMLIHVFVVAVLSCFLYGLTALFYKSQNKSLLFGDFKNIRFWQLFDFGRQNILVFSDQETRMQASCFWSTRTCWLVLLGMMVMSLRISCFRFSIWSKNQFSSPQRPNPQPQQLQQQQLMQHKLPLQIQSPAKTATKWQKKLLFCFVIFMIIVSTGIFYHFYQDTVFRRKETLSNMCDERARMLQDQFNAGLNHVHALAILVSTFHHGKTPTAMDQKTFGEYTERTAFERPLTSGVAYALKVTHSEREQFERTQGWTIKKMEHGDQTLVQDFDPAKMDPAPIQDEYAPVILSQRTVEHIVSIDMMSGKEDSENILRARKTGKGVLTSPFKLLKSNHLGVVLTFAVYNQSLPPDATVEQRIAATVG